MKKVIVFGGSGFIGKYLVCELVARKHCVSIYTRSQKKASDLKLFGHLGQVDVVSGELSDTTLIEKLVVESDIIVNLIGTISEPRVAVMQYLHVTFPCYLAKLAAEHGKILVHFSAMGADIAKSSVYASSKLEGETLIKDICERVVIVRPNLVFGIEDNFFNKFANLARIVPFIPVFGGGKNLLQPVYVGDVINLTVNLIAKKTTQGTYEICGPSVYSFKDLMKFVLVTTGRKKPVVHIPLFIAKGVAVVCEQKIVAFLTQPATGQMEPLVTRDQLELMKYDIISRDRTDAVVCSVPIEQVVPEYLAVYKNTADQNL